ncbi:MAG: endonuclease [Bacilli bacterium]|nr:endonuclease [Bacilli bacterium]
MPKSSITLRDNTAEEIRDYYSDLDDLSAAERSGDNLLKNLKPILKENMVYFSYDQVWKIYEITDRDWGLSPAENDTYNGTSYDSDTLTYTRYEYGEGQSNPGNDPYVHTLYRDRGNEDARIKEWGAHSGDNSTNREHVWCQSRGFKAREGSSAAAYGPAGTDVHHLMSGDGKVNTDHHNDKPYGNVDKTKTYKDAGSVYPWLAGNLAGSAIKTSPLDQVSEVFEPRDEDKGDIARACFYMVARYNNLAGEIGVISDYEPNLALADYATGSGTAEYSTDDAPVYMGIMSDLLEWNRLDPVDEYEIHRNNLIFNNYQHNRNPFIDFPQWADYIWGEGRGVRAAVPSIERLNTYTTVDAESVGGFANEFAAERTKARLSFSYTSTPALGDGSVTWRGSEAAPDQTTFPSGYSASIGGGVSMSAINPPTGTTNRMKVDGGVFKIFTSSTLSISVNDGYLTRISLYTSTTTDTGKLTKKTTVDAGTATISDGNMVITFTAEETSVTLSIGTSVYLSEILVEYRGRVVEYSDFSDVNLQFGYNKELPNNSGVTHAGIFVTDDPLYFSETVDNEAFAPSEPSELSSCVSGERHGYVSENETLKSSWFIGINLSEGQYETTFYAAAYVFIGGEVTFAHTSSFSLVSILETYAGMSGLSLEELAVVGAFKDSIN